MWFCRGYAPTLFMLRVRALAPLTPPFAPYVIDYNMQSLAIYCNSDYSQSSDDSPECLQTPVQSNSPHEANLWVVLQQNLQIPYSVINSYNPSSIATSIAGMSYQATYLKSKFLLINRSTILRKLAT